MALVMLFPCRGDGSNNQEGEGDRSPGGANQKIRFSLLTSMPGHRLDRPRSLDLRAKPPRHSLGFIPGHSPPERSKAASRGAAKQGSESPVAQTGDLPFGETPQATLGTPTKED